ncbi:hypothetical protein [Amaricoccus macauensis]|uniref:hypothetical protein n=1 Tax=Amaricoccus macauensis TaxID=57001 RepID=UPI003C7CD97B
MQDLTIATGDIVASSRLGADELDEVMSTLREASRLVWRWRIRTQPPEFVRFRGDGWQAVLPEPEVALRAALFFRARVRCLGPDRDTRVSIGIGSGMIRGGALGASAGPAFEVSGRGLDAMPRTARFAIDHADPPKGAPARERALVQAMFGLADEISRRWTVKQAQVFSRMLAPDAGPQKGAAEALGVSQQMIAKHLRTGGDWAIQQAMQTLEAGLALE